MVFEKNYLKLYTNDHFIPILASVTTTDNSTFPVRLSHGVGDAKIVINDSSRDAALHDIDVIYQEVVKGFRDVTTFDMQCAIAFLATAKTDGIITHQILATALYWMSACATGSVDPECYEHAGHVVAIVYRMMSHMQHFFGIERDTSDDSLYSKVWNVMRAVLEKYELVAAYVAATYGDGIFDADGNQIVYDVILGDVCVFASDADRAWSLAGHWKLARNRMRYDTTGFSGALPAWATFRHPDVLSRHCYTRFELTHDPLCLVLSYPSVFGYHKVWAAAVDADECDHTAAYSHVTVVSVYDAAYALDAVMHVSREGMVTAADHAIKACATALPDEYHTPHDLFEFYDRPTGDWPNGCGHTVREYEPDRVWKAFRKLSSAVHSLANDRGPYRYTSPVDELVDAAAACESGAPVDELATVYVSVMSLYVAETGMAEWVGRYLDATTDSDRADALTTIEDLILDFVSSLEYLCNILVRIGIGHSVRLHSLPGHSDHMYVNGPASDMANRAFEISRLVSCFTDSTLAVDNDVRRRMARAVMTGTAQAPVNIATE